MTKRLITILVGLCCPIVTTGWAQTVSMDPIRVPVLHFDSYHVNGLPPGESPQGWFSFKEGPRTGVYYTNAINLASRDIRYGDKIRLRTVGTFRKDLQNPDGTLTTGPEVPQPFLGLFFGSLRIAGLTWGPYKALSPVATGLPEYVTPPYTNLSGTFPTDIPEDFLIPPDAVTLCVPGLR
ncbi:MAG: hypothetical protein AB9869_25470 [Verrucomicrobiia bacterium]